MPDLCGVKWRACEEGGVQSKARELSEESIQHTLDRTEVQMLALIMQAEHKERVSQFKWFSKHRSVHLLRISAAGIHTAAKCANMNAAFALIPFSFLTLITEKNIVLKAYMFSPNQYLAVGFVFA